MRVRAAVVLAAACCVAACSGANHGIIPPRGSGVTAMPKSVSPAVISPAPMAKTAILPASTMQSPRSPDVGTAGLGWMQIPGSASQVTAAADGSIWVLSTQPAGPDKYIWHYANGVWSNISGLATQLSAGSNGSLYAVNSGGGTYRYKNGIWTALGGGAMALTAAQDGSVYVLSNGGTGPDKAIWHNVYGTWTQVPGDGNHLAAAMGMREYALAGGTIAPDGFYVLNSAGRIYYGNTDGTYVSLPGAASGAAPTAYGGLFVLGYPSNAGGENLWYYNLDTAAWSSIPGTAVSIAEAGGHLYAVTASGAIYMTNALPSTGAPLPFQNPGYYLWAPWDVAQYFQFPVQSGYDGMGETVAIVIESVPAVSDVLTYLSGVGITRRGFIWFEPVDGGGPLDTAGESTLDTETIAGLAPGANVIVYDMPDLSAQSEIDAYNQILSDGRANAVSMSYGGCEYPNLRLTIAPLFAQMAAQGIAAVASSGDDGNACYFGGPYYVGVSNPASDPNVIGVGGTETNPNPYYGPVVILGKSLWDDCPVPLYDFENCMGGGGVSGNASTLFSGYALPSYQRGVAGEASALYRNVPDVAMPGDNDLMYMASSGGWTGVEGTSWSAPQTASLIAEIYEYCGVTAVLNPVTMFYEAFAKYRYSDFLDVTTGNNSYMGTAPSYSGHEGFDNVSGLGSPFGMQIAPRLCPNNRPALIEPASHGTVALQQKAPGGPRVMPDVVKPISATDMGERDPQSPTRVALVLRATPTLPQDEQTVIAQLQSAGFTILRRFANHLVVDAQAPSRIVEGYFNTRIHNYMQRGYGVRFANTQPDIVPASIAPYVNGVVAQNLILARGSPPYFHPRHK